MSETEKTIVFSPNIQIKIKKWKVREGFQVNNNQLILLYELTSGNDTEIKRLKSTKCGVVKKRFHKEGDIVDAEKPLLELSDCIHATVIKDMCADCGADLRQDENTTQSEASVPMVHSVPELKVSQELAQELGKADTIRLLQEKKLVLLVDLDQTLIHTTNDNVPNNLKGVYHFQLYGTNSPWYHTRLRPGTFKFLENIAPYFELHICTFGARNYAHTIAQFLDEDGKYFSHRILSRDECLSVTYKTDNLRALFPCGDSMVCIIDDRQDVWNMATNLIQVKPYHFFQHTGDINAPPGMSKHELDGKGVNFGDLKSKTINTQKISESDGEIPSSSTEPIGSGSYKADEPEQCGNTDERDAGCSSKADKHKQSSINEPDQNSDTEKPDTGCNNKKADQSERNTNEPAVDCNYKNDEPKSSNKSDEPVAGCSYEVDKTDETKPSSSTFADSTTDDSDSEAWDEHLQPRRKPNKKRNETNDSAQNTNKISYSEENNGGDDTLIDVEDPDDYLLFLETILIKIHSRFYTHYDETKQIPDLKTLLPKIRSEVLLGKTLVFSGLVPTHIKLEKSKAYLIAKSLGANVTQQLTDETTHLVASTAGTFKVNAARKVSKIHIVSPDWLWTCAERWECVEEKLFPLDSRKATKTREPPAHCHSPKHVVNYNNLTNADVSSSEQSGTNIDAVPKFMDTINPYLMFSKGDLEAMNDDVNELIESGSSDEDSVDMENPPLHKDLRKRKREEEDEEIKRKMFHPNVNEEQECDKDSDASSSSKKSDSDDESPVDKFRRGCDLPSDLDMGDGDDSADSSNNDDFEDDGDWNMMGAALEREFLGLD